MKKVFYVLVCLFHRFRWGVLAAVLAAFTALLCGFYSTAQPTAEPEQTDEPVTGVVFVKKDFEIAEETNTNKYFDVPLEQNVQDRIFAECDKYGIPPEIVIAMIERESNFNTYSIGDDGRSFGLMQVQAKHHIDRMIALDCTDLFDPCENVTVGINYLAEKLDVHLGDMEKALTAYNKGHFGGTVTEYARDVLTRSERFGK